MNKRIKRKWVKHLRSGKYKQGNNELRNEDNYFCCLGVLCNVHAIEHPKIAVKQMDRCEYMDFNGYPPPTVRDWAGLTEDQIETLIEMNDLRGRNFDFIANWIEREL